MRIALCPGHHKSAKGAVNKKHGLNEHDEATKVVDHAYEILTRQGHTVVIITGTLGEKVRAINAGDFDLVIDLHFNADADHLDPEDFDNSRGHGAMVMYCPKARVYGDTEPHTVRREQAAVFSFAMHSKLGNRDLGGRPGWYWGSNPPKKKDYFLRKTNCVAFIPEPGYIDNNGFAEAWLVSGRHREIAEAICNGIAVLEKRWV
jgi:N-acetylmuramoyl-L-alanine amidase